MGTFRALLLRLLVAGLLMIGSGACVVPADSAISTAQVQSAAGVAVPDIWRVRATLTHDGRWSLHWCNTEARGNSLRLRADDVLAMQLLQAVQPQPDQRGRRTLLWHTLADGCVLLHYDLRAIAQRNRSGIGYRLGDDLLSWSWTWWWRPLNAGADPVELRLDLPKGWRASAPWPRCGPDCWSIGATRPQWPAILALGRFATVRSTLPGGVIELVLTGSPDQSQSERLASLAPIAAAQMQAVYGRMPTPELQVLLLPSAQSAARRDDAVHFGQLLRGGLGGVSLWVNPAASKAELEQHWILPHELAHLFHPHLGEGRGRWLAEGLASYYQHLMRTRAGQLSSAAGWEQLLQGFARGRADQHPQALDELAADVGARRAYMRVYWSGAAFWLLTDLELRARKSSLDAILQRFAATHLPAKQTWDAERFLGELDRGLTPPVFVPLAERIGRSNRFPDLADALRQLGLSADQLDKSGALTEGDATALSQQIMAPR